MTQPTPVHCRKLERDFAIARTLMENAHILALLLSPDGIIIDLNHHMADSLGQPLQNLKGALLWPYLLSESRDRHQALVQRVLAERQPYRHETIYAGQWYDSSLTPCLDDQGQAIGVAIVAWNINERKRAEQEGERRFTAMANAAPVLIWVSGTDKLCTYFNKPWLAFTGRTLEQELGNGWTEGVHPDDLARFLEIYWGSFNSRQPFRTEYRLRRHDGQYRWMLDNGVPDYHADGGFVGYIGCAIDITAAKQAEAILSASEAKLHAIIDASPIAMAVEDGHNNITFLNRKFVEIFGYTLEDVPTEAAWWPLAYPDPAYRERCIQVWQAATEKAHREGTALQLEDYRVTCKDCSVRDIRCSLAPLGTSHVVLFDDMTERNQMEERLRQSQKLEGIGHLAGGMAHEFNNILAAMMMSLSMAESLITGIEPREHLDTMQGLCQRSADLVKQLLAFSRQSVIRIQPMDLAAAVSRQCQMLGRLLGEGITVEFSSPDALSWVNADKSMVEQVLLNLCLNARDAMRHGGLIRLCLSEAEIGAQQVKAHAEARPGKFVCLSVADTGCGMDEHTIKRLFEPFFTTKPVGQGTGLGLATVRGMIQQHHGWVEVESRVGEGSTFRVYLPAVAQPLIPPHVAKKETLSHGKGTILLVEDEPALRKATRIFLARKGYTVLEAADGREALTRWEEHREEIDLIYTDMVMPGELTGLQLAERILKDKPGVKAIITSGYNTDLVDLSKIAESCIVYLPKPCSPATLASVIQECLRRA